MEIKNLKKILIMMSVVFVLSSCGGGSSSGGDSGEIENANASENDLVSQLNGINEGANGQSFDEANLNLEEVNILVAEFLDYFLGGSIGIFGSLVHRNQNQVENQDRFSIEEEIGIEGEEGLCVHNLSMSGSVNREDESAKLDYTARHDCDSFQISPYIFEFDENVEASFTGQASSSIRISGDSDISNRTLSFSSRFSFSGQYRGKLAATVFRSEDLEANAQVGVDEDFGPAQIFTNVRTNALAVIYSDSEIFSCRANFDDNIFDSDNLNLRVNCQRGNQAPNRVD
jgi:hypothetical protein